MQKNTFKKNSLALALAIAFPVVAAAQDAPAEPQIQRVEVTGSSIKRTAAEVAGSVQILSRDDIEKTGQTTALGVLTSSAAINTASNSASASSGSFATGSSSISMRGLGKVATLVLVNGRRIAPYGLSDNAQENFTNLDAIASDAIERIEILKDGASAIYGSDAIAGVVNIILRNNFQGAKISTQYQEAQHFNDMRNRNASAIIGWGDLDTDGYNTYLTVEGYKRDGYSTGDLRDHYPAWYAGTPTRSTWNATSAYSPTGNYYRSASDYVAAPGCPAEAIEGALCKWDALPYSGLTTDNSRHAVVSSTHFKIGRDINANFEVTAAGATNEYIVAPFSTQNGGSTTSTSVWYNVNAGRMVGPFSYPKLPVGNNGNTTASAVELRARLMDTGDGFNFNRTDSHQSRVMLALDGNYLGWDWKSALGMMKSTALKATRAVSAAGYTNAIVNNTYQFGEQNDPALLESMFPVRTTYGKAEIKFFDATISKTVAQLPAGPLNVAIGTDIRSNAYRMKSSDNVLNGELVGIFGLQVDDQVGQYALFTEADVPLTKRIKLNAAVRADKTDNADAHLSPKLGLTFNATDSLLLRATASGGFRAPNIVESGNGLGRSSVSTVSDPRRCPTASALNKLIQNAVNATTADKALGNSFQSAECSAAMPSFVSSNPDLKPETSRSFTGGFVFEPAKNWSMGMDYYFIERRNEIGTRAVSDILLGEDSLPQGQLVRIDNSANDAQFLALVNKYAPGNTLNYGGVGKLGLVYNPYVNSGRTRASGVDFDASGRLRLWGTDVRLKLDGNYLWKYQQYSVAKGAYDKNIVGTYDYGAGHLKLRLRAYVKQGNFDHALTGNFASGYSSNTILSPTWCVTNGVAADKVGECDRVGSNTTFDYNLAYSGIPHVKLNLYVNNVFNQPAPINYRDGYTTQFRLLGARASYTF